MNNYNVRGGGRQVGNFTALAPHVAGGETKPILPSHPDPGRKSGLAPHVAGRRNEANFALPPRSGPEVRTGAARCGAAKRSQFCPPNPIRAGSPDWRRTLRGGDTKPILPSHPDPGRKSGLAPHVAGRRNEANFALPTRSGPEVRTSAARCGAAKRSQFCPPTPIRAGSPDWRHTLRAAKRSQFCPPTPIRAESPDWRRTLRAAKRSPFCPPTRFGPEIRARAARCGRQNEPNISTLPISGSFRLIVVHSGGECVSLACRACAGRTRGGRVDAGSVWKSWRLKAAGPSPGSFPIAWSTPFRKERGANGEVRIYIWQAWHKGEPPPISL